MMRGIDISNWQAGIDLTDYPYDFIVAKATGGTSFVDANCDEFIQHAIANKVPFGFYHFAKDGQDYATGDVEADFFVDNCEGYFGKGIPILDLEDAAIPDWATFAEKFVSRVHQRTGVWPIVYTGFDGCQRLAWNKLVTENCGFWFAGYPLGYIDHWIEDTNVHDYYTISERCNVVMWQFTSGLKYRNLSVDANVAYMDKNQWALYAQGDNVAQNSDAPETLDDLETALDTLAKYVWLGYFGNGETRKQALYDAVQKRVDGR